MATDIQTIIDRTRFKVRASAFIIEDGEILMNKNEFDPMYYTVGGKIEVGESSEEAVIREAFEETGIHYEIDRLLFTQELFYPSKFKDDRFEQCHEFMYHYLMKETGVKTFHNESRTHDNLLETQEWIPLEEVKNIYTYPRMLDIDFLNLPQTPQHLITHETYK